MTDALGEVKNYVCDECKSTRAVYSDSNKIQRCDICKTAMTFVGVRTYIKRRPKDHIDTK